MRQTAFIAAALLGVVSLLPAADPALVNLVMPDAKILAGINVTRAKTSVFGQFLITSIPMDAGYQEFVKASGFDPSKDLQEVLFATNVGQGVTLVVARGNFNPEKIIALATAEGGHTSTTYNGVSLLSSTGPTPDGLAFLPGSSIAIAGDLVSVKAAIDRRNSANSIAPALAAKLVSYAAADGWSASIAPFSSLPTQTGNPLGGMFQGDLLKKVVATSGSIMLSTPIQLAGEFVADSPADATALSDVVKFLASMVQMNSGKTGAPVTNIIQNLKVTTEQSTVKIGLAIAEADLENLVKSAETAKAKPARI